MNPPLDNEAEANELRRQRIKKINEDNAAAEAAKKEAAKKAAAQEED